MATTGRTFTAKPTKQPWVILIKDCLESVESWISSVQKDSILICRQEDGTVYFVDPDMQEPVVLDIEVPETLELPGLFDFLSFVVMHSAPEERKDVLLVLMQNLERIPYNVGRETTKKINGGRNKIKVAVEPGVYAEDLQKWLLGGVRADIYLATDWGNRVIDIRPQLEAFCYS